MPRRSITLSEWGVASEVQSDKHTFRKGDILFGKIRPYFHKVGICLTDGVASTDAIVIRPRSESHFSLVLMTVSSDLFVAHATQSSHGSKMPRANWKVLERFPVLVPPETLLRDFNNLIAPIVSQLRTLALTNRKLQAARDLLLPKLMSGEIAV
jgi:type I restriction enzyme S subunit